MPRVTLTGPSPRAQVELRANGSARWLSATVIDSSELGLVVTAPGAADLLVRSGDRVAVRWLVQNMGIGVLETVVAGTSRDVADATWLLRADGRPSVEQRRRHVRVPVTVAAKADWPERQQQMVTLDLSEGGVRCLAPLDVEFCAGEPVVLAVDLHGEPVIGSACVVRSSLSPGGTTVAFRFTGLTNREADRIRRFVFARDVALNALAR